MLKFEYCISNIAQTFLDPPHAVTARQASFFKMLSTKAIILPTLWPISTRSFLAVPANRITAYGRIAGGMVFEEFYGKTQKPSINSQCLPDDSIQSISELGFIGRLNKQPKIVFAQAIPAQWNEFLDSILPRIAKTTSFILITGGSDETIPDQVDQRFPGYASIGLTKRLEELHDDSRIIAWYVHNLDRHYLK